MSEDVTVENDTTVEAEDVTVEAQDETEVEVEQPEKTVEEKLSELEKDVQGKQAKIDRQVKAYKELQAALQRERQEREQLLSQAKGTQSKEPSEDDFDTHEEYVNAVIEYRAEQKIVETQKKMAEMQEAQAYSQLLAQRESIKATQEAEFIQTNPLYKHAAEEVGLFVQQNVAPPAVAEAVIDVLYEGNIPAVINYFGENNGERLGELQKIMNMSPVKAGIEIYKIQQKLKTPVEKKTINVPKPIAKVKSASGVTKDLGRGDVLKNLGLK